MPLVGPCDVCCVRFCFYFCRAIAAPAAVDQPQISSSIAGARCGPVQAASMRLLRYGFAGGQLAFLHAALVCTRCVPWCVGFAMRLFSGMARAVQACSLDSHTLCAALACMSSYSHCAASGGTVRSALLTVCRHDCVITSGASHVCTLGRFVWTRLD